MTFNAKTQRCEAASTTARGWSRARSAYNCKVRSGLSGVFSAVHLMRPGTGRAPRLAAWLLCSLALKPLFSNID
jgi:hypothetical protein